MRIFVFEAEKIPKKKLTWIEIVSKLQIYRAWTENFSPKAKKPRVKADKKTWELLPGEQ